MKYLSKKSKWKEKIRDLEDQQEIHERFNRKTRGKRGEKAIINKKERNVRG